MGLRPAHGDENTSLRFIESKPGYARLLTECSDLLPSTIVVTDLLARPLTDRGELFYRPTSGPESFLDWPISRAGHQAPQSLGLGLGD